MLRNLLSKSRRLVLSFITERCAAFGQTLSACGRLSPSACESKALIWFHLNNWDRHGMAWGSIYLAPKIDLVCGLEHFLFSHIVGIIIPIDFHNSPPVRWGLLDFMSVACSSPPRGSSSPLLLLLNRDSRRTVFSVGPQPRPIHAQCPLPDLSHDPRPVFPARLQPRSTPSVKNRDLTSDGMSERMPDRMSERMSERMPDRTSDGMPDQIWERQCQIQCQKECQIECQKECQIECQMECQIKC